MRFPGARRFVEPAALAAIGAAVLLDTLGYPEALAPGAPGPAFFPRILGAGLIAGAAILALRRPDRADPGGARPGSGPRIHRRRRVWVASAWIAAALSALSFVGTLFVLPPLVGGLLWLSGERTPSLLVGVPAAFTALVWLVFSVLLGVPLP